MKINIKKCLELFDERHSKEHQGHTNAIIGMIGEEIAFESFLHYTLSRKRQLKIVAHKFQADNFPLGAGPRLDKWFVEQKEKKIYQCEIKNWCAWSTVGIDIRINGVEETAQNYWVKLLREFDGQNNYGKTSKVLMKMKKPKDYKNFKLEPVLILWWPISPPNHELEPLFSVDVKKLNIRFKTKFKKLHIFSVSLYFRELLREKKKLVLDMSDSHYRIKILNSIGVL